MLENRNQTEIQSRLQETMSRYNYDAMVLLAPEAIFYATGFASQFLYQSNQIGYTVAVVLKTGKVTIICNEFEKQAAVSSCKDIDIVSYPVWIYIEDYAKGGGDEKPPQPDLNRSFKMAAEIIRNKFSNPSIGIQMEKVSKDNWEYLQKEFGTDKVQDCSEALVESRKIKTDWEVFALRKAANLSEVAMYKTAKEVVVGMTEADISRLFKTNCYSLSSEINDVIQAHTVSKNFAPAVIARHDRVGMGDIVRLDGGPIYNGYCSDLARTFAIGNSTNKERERIYAALWKASQRAREIIGPGVKMCDVFNEMQRIIQSEISNFKRGHYGHSIGCNRFTEEYPFISSKETSTFQPNMVFCLEAPYYSSKNHSFNIEDTFLITDNGCEFFTNANESLYING